jgi:SAM-dependent methyltransferase
LPATPLTQSAAEPPPRHHLCPPWFAWVIDNPFRRWLHKPEEIFARHIAPGSTVVELGCGSGPFTLALARRVGPSGKVIAADLQPEMLAKVQKRVARAGLLDRVQLHPCEPKRVGLSTRVDFVLAFWMVHEVLSAADLFAEMCEALNAPGKLLLTEPKFHVGRAQFEIEVEAALAANFKLLERPAVRLSQAALFGK